LILLYFDPIAKVRKIDRGRFFFKDQGLFVVFKMIASQKKIKKIQIESSCTQNWK
jgi:hypothetical protein